MEVKDGMGILFALTLLVIGLQCANGQTDQNETMTTEQQAEAATNSSDQAVPTEGAPTDQAGGSAGGGVVESSTKAGDSARTVSDGTTYRREMTDAELDAISMDREFRTKLKEAFKDGVFSAITLEEIAKKMPDVVRRRLCKIYKDVAIDMSIFFYFASAAGRTYAPGIATVRKMLQCGSISLLQSAGQLLQEVGNRPMYGWNMQHRLVYEAMASALLSRPIADLTVKNLQCGLLLLSPEKLEVAITKNSIENMIILDLFLVKCQGFNIRDDLVLALVVKYKEANAWKPADTTNITAIQAMLPYLSIEDLSLIPSSSFQNSTGSLQKLDEQLMQKLLGLPRKGQVVAAKVAHAAGILKYKEDTGFVAADKPKLEENFDKIGFLWCFASPDVFKAAADILTDNAMYEKASYGLVMLVFSGMTCPSAQHAFDSFVKGYYNNDYSVLLEQNDTALLTFLSMAEVKTIKDASWTKIAFDALKIQPADPEQSSTADQSQSPGGEYGANSNELTGRFIPQVKWNNHILIEYLWPKVKLAYKKGENVDVIQIPNMFKGMLGSSAFKSMSADEVISKLSDIIQSTDTTLDDSQPANKGRARHRLATKRIQKKVKDSVVAVLIQKIRDSGANAIMENLQTLASSRDHMRMIPTKELDKITPAKLKETKLEISPGKLMRLVKKNGLKPSEVPGGWRIMKCKDIKAMEDTQAVDIIKAIPPDESHMLLSKSARCFAAKLISYVDTQFDGNWKNLTATDAQEIPPAIWIWIDTNTLGSLHASTATEEGVCNIVFRGIGDGISFGKLSSSKLAGLASAALRCLEKTAGDITMSDVSVLGDLTAYMDAADINRIKVGDTETAEYIHFIEVSCIGQARRDAFEGKVRSVPPTGFGEANTWTNDTLSQLGCFVNMLSHEAISKIDMNNLQSTQSCWIKGERMYKSCCANLGDECGEWKSTLGRVDRRKLDALPATLKCTDVYSLPEEAILQLTTKQLDTLTKTEIESCLEVLSGISWPRDKAKMLFDKILTDSERKTTLEGSTASTEIEHWGTLAVALTPENLGSITFNDDVLGSIGGLRNWTKQQLQVVLDKFMIDYSLASTADLTGEHLALLGSFACGLNKTSVEKMNADVIGESWSAIIDEPCITDDLAAVEALVRKFLDYLVPTAAKRRRETNCVTIEDLLQLQGGIGGATKEQLECPAPADYSMLGAVHVQGLLEANKLKFLSGEMIGNISSESIKEHGGLINCGDYSQSQRKALNLAMGLEHCSEAEAVDDGSGGGSGAKSHIIVQPTLLYLWILVYFTLHNTILVFV